MEDDTLLTFGKYNGKRIGDVPADYLLWLADQDWIIKFPEIQTYVEKNRHHLEHESALKELHDPNDYWGDRD